MPRTIYMGIKTCDKIKYRIETKAASFYPVTFLLIGYSGLVGNLKMEDLKMSEKKESTKKTIGSVLKAVDRKSVV